MNERYTMSELAAALGVDGNTVRAWLAAAGLEPTRDRYDARRNFIPGADAERLAAAHDRTLADVANLPATLEGAWREIAALRRRVAELEVLDNRQTPIASVTRYEGQETALYAEQDDSLSRSYAPRPARPSRASTPSASRAERRTTETPDLPADLLPLAQFIEAHGIAVSTAVKQNAHGVFAREGPYKLGRNTQTYGIDQVNAVKALRHWLARGLLTADRLGQCGMTGCPCGELRGLNVPSMSD